MAIIPGTEGMMGGVMAQFENAFGIFLMGITAVIISGVTFGFLYILNEKLFSFKIPVILKCEVGDTVIAKRDKMKILRRGDKYEIRFKKNGKIMAEVPRDDYSFFTTGGFMSPTKKCFEAFVRNDQATWAYPKPVVGMVEEERIYVDDKGKSQTRKIQIPSFITMPSNLIRYYIDRTRKNIELSSKLKWWENPQVLAFGMMGIFLIGVLFLFMMNRSSAEIAMEAVRMGGRVMEQASGQVIP